MWVQCFEQVDEEPITLAVECLDEDARERTAATIAWLTVEAFGCGGGDTPETWKGFMDEVLCHHVTFAVAEERMPSLGSDWWYQAIGLALTQFMRHNELAPSVNRHIEALQRIGQSSRRES